MPTLRESYNMNNLPELNEDDLRYLSGLANYVLESNSKESVKKLKEVVKNGRKGAALAGLVGRESKAKLEGRTHIYYSLEENQINETGASLTEDIKDKLFKPSSDILVGSVDENCVKRWNKLEESNWALIQQPIMTENIVCYFPVLREWVKRRLSEKVDPIQHRNIMRACLEAFIINEWKKEIIVERNQEQFGKVTEIFHK